MAHNLPSPVPSWFALIGAMRAITTSVSAVGWSEGSDKCGGIPTGLVPTSSLIPLPDPMQRLSRLSVSTRARSARPSLTPSVRLVTVSRNDKDP
jgi:hypothetical protein